jgi:nicotinate phosphoribosyltransferase
VAAADAGSSGLFTDLYELTMAASYLKHGLNGAATFDLFVRRLPPRRNFLIACGLDDALRYLEAVRFWPDDLAYLEGLGLFGHDFLDYLGGFRFRGEVWAIAEGEAVFAEEPLVSVTAPLIEAQVVETFLLNCLNFQTMVASKAARIAIACGERPFVDFSPRRDHGTDAALKAARAAYVGGAAATSNVLAGREYGLPVSGTMAHSYVMAFGDETEAFRAFAADFPDRSTLLVDTYDVEEGARRAAAVSRQMRRRTGRDVQAVRLDSGDVLTSARAVRRILDEAGCEAVRIFASGDLDEDRIAEVLQAGAPVDAFGVGTMLGTSADAPYLGGVYKLVEYDGGARLKLSPEKATLPGRKQVLRRERDGVAAGDVIALREEEPPRGSRPLLRPVMRDGRRLEAPEPLAALRERRVRAVASLAPALRSLGPAPPYPVRRSAGLQALLEAARPR